MYVVVGRLLVDLVYAILCMNVQEFGVPISHPHLSSCSMAGWCGWLDDALLDIAREC